MWRVRGPLTWILTTLLRMPQEKTTWWSPSSTGIWISAPFSSRYSAVPSICQGGGTALTQAVVDYLTELYGPPDDSQTPGETNMIAWSNAAGQPKAGTSGPVVYTFDNGDVHVCFYAAGDYQN